MTSMTSSIAHDTDIRTGTNHDTKVIIPLNNPINVMNAMVSLMAPSVSFDMKHVLNMYVPKTNKLLNCQIC